MRLTVGLDSRDVPGAWRQAEQWAWSGPDDGEWPAAAHDALQRGIESLRDRLDGVGTDEADLQLCVVRSDDEADVRAALTVAGRTVVRNRVALDLAEALAEALREIGRAVEDGAFDAMPTASGPGLQVPWRLVTDSAHQYAQHCVTNAVRRGDLTAGRIDARDLAETALSERLADDQTVRDLPAAMRELCTRIEALLADEIVRESVPVLPLDEADPDDGTVGIQDQPVDTPPLQVSDHLGVVPDLDERIDHADERHRLVGALFELGEPDRVLFVEFAAGGATLDGSAAARGADPVGLGRRVRAIVQRLGQRLGLESDAVLIAYRALGEELRDERRVVNPGTGYGLGTAEASAFD